MRQLSPYAVMQAKLDADVAAIEDKDDHAFDRFFVEAATVLAAYGDSQQDKFATYAARGLLSWSDEDRDAYLQQVDVPGRVFQQMANPDPWPAAAGDMTPPPGPGAEAEPEA